MRKFHVVIGYSGTKTFEIEAESLTAAKEYAQKKCGYLEHEDNPIDDCLDDFVVSVKPVVNKADAYIELYKYVQDITDNQYPLELLEHLKPEVK